MGRMTGQNVINVRPFIRPTLISGSTVSPARLTLAASTKTGEPMGKVAYTIKDAAKNVSLDECELVAAIQNQALIARRMGGRLLILRSDLKKWAKAQPNYLRTIR